jgi:hypothetical protein
MAPLQFFSLVNAPDYGNVPLPAVIGFCFATLLFCGVITFILWRAAKKSGSNPDGASYAQGALAGTALLWVLGVSLSAPPPFVFWVSLALLSLGLGLFVGVILAMQQVERTATAPAASSDAPAGSASSTAGSSSAAGSSSSTTGSSSSTAGGGSSGAGSSGSTAGTGGSPTGAASAPSNTKQTAAINLARLADTITKLLTGITLVNFKDITGWLWKAFNQAGTTLFRDAPGMPSVMVVYAAAFSLMGALIGLFVVRRFLRDLFD